MGKFIKILTLIITVIVFVTAVSADSKIYSWYCKKTDDHSQPPTPSELLFTEKYGGISIDRNHGDDSEDKVIYLTFDVGYENGNVEKVLDTLKKHNATGTFFILEHVVRDNTDLVRRMFKEGHTVGNHTMSHKNMAKVDNETFKAELSGLEDLCFELTGERPKKLYRPPEGTFSEENMKLLSSMGYKTVFWSFAYADWDNSKQPDPDASLKKLLSRLHNGEILLLHPTSATNAAILDEFITTVKNMGYRIGDISELCGM